jgi:hypothetical protein
MNAFKVLSVAGAVLALLSCGSEQKPIEITSAHATGTVGGMVLNAVTREPLSGVKVTLLAGGVPSTMDTDATGAFTFAQVGSGYVAVSLDHDDYLSASLTGYLLGAGEYPVDNASLTFGPIGLIPSSGTFAAMLIFDDGSPAGGITVTARTNTRFYDYSGTDSYSGTSQVTTVWADTDPTGVVTFTGLPDFVALGDGSNDWITVVVPPIPADSGAPSLYKYPGGAFPFRMTQLVSLTPIIVLEAASPGALAVTASNVQALEATVANPVPSIIPQAGPLYIVFNQPLDPTATKVTLFDEGSPAVAPVDRSSAVQTSISFNMIQLGFTPELTAASEYNLVIHAVAGAGDQLVRYDGWAPFFTQVSGSMVRPTLNREIINALTHEEVLHLTFAEPIGTGNPAANVFSGDAYCVAFFSADFGTADGGIGDQPGETGNASCNVAGVTFMAEEPDPTGMAGLSGYTKHWKIDRLPTKGGGLESLPAGTPFNLVFSRIADSTRLMKRVNGEPVQDFVGTSSLTLP